MTASAPQASNTESQASAPKHSAPQTKRKRSRLLTVRLSRFLAAAVAIALVTMLAASAFAMRSWMTSKLDSSLESMLSRLEKNAELTLEQPLPPPPPHHDDDAQASASNSPSAGPTATPTDKGPRGLRGPGSSDGQLQLIKDDDEIVSGVVKQFDVVELDSAAQQQILSLRCDRHGHNVSLPNLGSFRVMCGQSESRTLVVGLSLAANNSTLIMLVALEGVIALVVIAGATFIGRKWIRREMLPLGEVAATARNIGSQDLIAAPTVDTFDRVDSSIAQPGDEVGDVGFALNTMIDNVETALQARAESEQRLRQFVADASHELRTPLASIQGYTQLLQRGATDQELALSRIASESARMSGLVEDLLLLARLDAGRELASDPVDVIPLAIDAVSDAHAAGPDHQWSLDLPEIDDEADSCTSCTVLGDESALRQVFANLVNNARIHTPAGTHVKVGVQTIAGTASTPGFVRLSVADDGPGIAPELRATVFDRFVRGDTSRSRQGKGSSGLGLSIVSSIAEALGGRVDVDTLCEGEGKPGEHGTTFSVILPVADD
ncbi:MAG: HAMP domain-containing sensor histidine kinase [Actinomyces sp.]|uniref:sensor histidine kinase n=1 Tax=Actinomyces sp. TaxID=29317 RepID=UPI0028FE74E1|nr:HAMP domain-containing sensor histidine kinase [Actinomyces sp.]MDU2259577.1 HAMP domain-containing sensor histidine kinase [Actinomyces sp.]